MDVVGSEIGQKMRSAIKAKLTELGCYVDDELPDYVMVMVANKRTRTQMEDDLLLFLGDNTESFVNWLHQVLKKLQEVTVTAPLKQTEQEKIKERSTSKERKPKVKKLKEKSKKGDSSKKAKKKDKLKEKLHRKKEEKKAHKSKKKSKHHESIRPNIPPLLMNMEKESEPSITDVFAGQILKNHGVIIENPNIVVKMPILEETKKPILPIIDPATIPSQLESSQSSIDTNQVNSQELTNRASVSSLTAPREEQIEEINKIEARIQGLKQKLEEQLDESLSDDEDFINIRTEAEELMNDFVEDVFQEISQPAPTATPPLRISKSPVNTTQTIPNMEIPKETPKDVMETLPQIELNLPKRPIRERLGLREELKKVSENKEKTQKRVDSPKTSDKRNDSPERFTPEREPEFRSQSKSAKSRLGDPPELRKGSISEDSDKSESNSKRLTSKVSIDSRPTRSTCASVVRVRPRPRVTASASSLLLRAVADAHKSLLNIPPKVDTEPQKVKRALVLPMRRCVDAQKIVIQVPAGDRLPDANTGGHTDNLIRPNKSTDEPDKGACVPFAITKKINNTEYMPPRLSEGRNATRRDDSFIIETINIHNTTVDKEKSTQFIVTMDGYHPNAFLAKKLMTEGLLDDEDLNLEKSKENPEITEITNNVDEVKDIKSEELKSDKTDNMQNKRLSNTSEESDTQVIIKQEKHEEELPIKRKISESSTENQKEECIYTKKRRASPIVFDVVKKEKVRERERTESVSSDNHVIITTTNSHKYDSVPPLSQTDRPTVPCRAFPLCRYGAACAFTHPRCKFAAACTRRACVYAHPQPRPAAPLLASHVVPAANYKTISSSPLPAVCKYYPNCVNPACHFYHPKPCRYGKHCLNKLECNFYHSDTPVNKWRYPV